MANGDMNGAAAPPRPGGSPPMKKSTRNWIIIGAIGLGGLAIWYVVKGRGSSSSQTSAADLAAQGIDPNTGQPYASEYGGYGAAGGGGTPSLYGYYDPNTGQYITGVGSQSSGGVVLAPSTNAEWAQQVEAYLTNLGYDGMTVAAAVGKYLTGQTLTSDQAGIVAAAKGFFGNPPTTPPVPPVTNPGGQGSGGGDNDHHHKRHKREHPKGNGSLWPVDIRPWQQGAQTSMQTLTVKGRQIFGQIVGGKKIV